MAAPQHVFVIMTPIDRIGHSHVLRHGRHCCRHNQNEHCRMYLLLVYCPILIHTDPLLHSSLRNQHSLPWYIYLGGAPRRGITFHCTAFQVRPTERKPCSRSTRWNRHRRIRCIPGQWANTFQILFQRKCNARTCHQENDNLKFLGSLH